jgi:hypothetical protein
MLICSSEDITKLIVYHTYPCSSDVRCTVEILAYSHTVMCRTGRFGETIPPESQRYIWSFLTIAELTGSGL